MKNVHGIWLPDSDNHFEAALRNAPIVDRLPTYQLKKYLKARDHVGSFAMALDIGAHVGLWSRVMALDFREVVAFEPVGAHRECFVRNVTRNNVELRPFALSDARCILNMAMPEGNSGNACVVNDVGETVQAWPLDSMTFRRQIGLIKIDVEGFEAKVLVGACNTIKAHRPVVIIEQKPNNAERYGFAQKDALAILKSWGAIEVAEMSGDHILRF